MQHNILIVGLAEFVNGVDLRIRLVADQRGSIQEHLRGASCLHFGLSCIKRIGVASGQHVGNDDVLQALRCIGEM